MLLDKISDVNEMKTCVTQQRKAAKAEQAALQTHEIEDATGDLQTRLSLAIGQSNVLRVKYAGSPPT